MNPFPTSILSDETRSMSEIGELFYMINQKTARDTVGINREGSTNWTPNHYNFKEFVI